MTTKKIAQQERRKKSMTKHQARAPKAAAKQATTPPVDPYPCRLSIDDMKNLESYARVAMSEILDAWGGNVSTDEKRVHYFAALKFLREIELIAHRANVVKPEVTR